MRGSKVGSAAFVGGALAPLLAIGPALAHNPKPAPYIGDWLPTTRAWYYWGTASLSTSPVAQDAINRGGDAWDNVTNANMAFSVGGTDLSLMFGDCANNTYNRNGIFWEFIDGTVMDGWDIYGQVALCAVATSDPTDYQIHSFDMRFDSGNTWYTSTGTPPANQPDLWSVAAHEFGHAGGFHDHWENYDSSLCGAHTMCKTIPAGTTNRRSLELHDQHTFAIVY
jgi:hypothetical protein